MDHLQGKPTSHVSRLSLRLLLAGVGALAVSTALQWMQLRGGRGPHLDGWGVALTAQLLMVVGTVALTGAVFGYVLLAVRRDRDDHDRLDNQTPDQEPLG